MHNERPLKKQDMLLVKIMESKDLNASKQQQISELFTQLSPNKKQLTLEEILEESNQTTVAYCQNGDFIVGLALLSTYSVISGKKGWIEDVVVAKNQRGKGIGRKLIQKLLEVAEKKNLTEVLLFTEDHRLPAIHLYKSLGFAPKNSKIYVLKR